MWYIDKEGDAYLIKDLVELTLSANFQEDTTAYDITAHFKELGNIVLATLSTKEECFKFRNDFLQGYLANEDIYHCTAIVERMK